MNNAVSLQELFTNRLFRVPDYQRGYAWSERNWDDFLEDLDLLAPGKLHYTGTIVLDRIHKPGPGEAPQATVIDRTGRAYEEFDIVDGQQRLTTVVLLLDAIRRELAIQSDLGPLAVGTTEAYVQVPSAAGEPLHKLRLNEDTDSYWRDSVLADWPAPTQAQNASQERLAGQSKDNPFSEAQFRRSSTVPASLHASKLPTAVRINPPKETPSSR